MEDNIIRFPVREAPPEGELTEKEQRLYDFALEKYPARYTTDRLRNQLKDNIIMTRDIPSDKRHAAALSRMLPGLSPGIVLDAMCGHLHTQKGDSK